MSEAYNFDPPYPPVGKPRNEDGSINYDYLQLGEWWNRPSMKFVQGFCSDERFARAGDRVIKRTNREKTRASRKLVDADFQRRFGDSTT